MSENVVNKRTDGELLAGVCGIIAGAAALGADAMLGAEMPALIKGELRGWLADAAARFAIAATSPMVWEQVVLETKWRDALRMFLGNGGVGSGGDDEI